MSPIVITGMGSISALGPECETFAGNLLKGTCGIGPITLFDTGGFQITVAAEVQNFRETDLFPKAQLAQLDRVAQFAVLSAREAVSDAGVTFEDSGRTTVIHGTGIGGQNTQDEPHHRLYAQGAKRLHPLSVPRAMPCAGASQISLDLGITGPVFGTTSACASAGHAIAVGAMMLRSGMVDVAITGGSEACIAPVCIKAWEALRVMARDTCRPFSKGRGGMVIGEGAGTLVLETLEHAQARGAHIYAELAGIGMSSDAHHLVQPLAAGIAQSISAALEDAGLVPGEIDYINAHGTGTAQNDPTETQAIHAVFGDRAREIPVSSSKSMFGHTLGACSALEAIATVIAMNAGVAPPTIGYLAPDPRCDLHYVPNAPRSHTIRAALSHSFAFGGLNTVLAFRKWTGEYLKT